MDDNSIENQLFYVGVDETLAGTKEMSEKGQNEVMVSEHFMMPLSDLKKTPQREYNPLKFNKSEKYKLEKVTIDWDTCIKKCNEETLIYIFFNIIDEPMQMNAVEELYKKGWRYHRKLQVWMSRGFHEAGPSGHMSNSGNSKDHISNERGRKDSSSSNGSSSLINNHNMGQSQWNYFNLSEWTIMPIPSSFPPINETDFVQVTEFKESMKL